MPLNLDEIEALKLRTSSAEKVDEIVYRGGRWEIHATYGTVSDHCPSCGGLLALHGWSKTRFLDSPARGEHVRLHVTRPRYRCRKCKKTCTPNIFGLVDSHRVTDRLVLHILENVFSFNSIRELAVSVGTTAKTVAEILNDISEQVRSKIVTPVELIIHELRVNESRHLVLLNSANGSLVDFLPSHPAQLECLDTILHRFNEMMPTQVVSIPADRAILKTVASSCPSARIELPLTDIQLSLSRTLVGLGTKTSKQGKVGSVSRIDAERIAGIRRNDLVNDDYLRYSISMSGEPIEFWKLYEAKEQLLYAFEKTAGKSWFNLFESWFSTLSMQHRIAFQDIKLLITEAKRFDVTLRHEPAKPLLVRHLNLIHDLLSKPGMAFSTDSLTSLVLCFRALHEPKKFHIDPNAPKPSWTDEPWTFFW